MRRSWMLCRRSQSVSWGLGRLARESTRYLGTHAFDGRWLIAVVTTLATVVGLLVYFRRKGWVAG
jgi:hypothetical protein